MLSPPVCRFVVLAAAWLAADPRGAVEAIVVPASAAAAWTGGSPGSESKPDGAASVRWEPGRSSSLSLRPAIADLPMGGTIQVWIHASQASGDWLNVAVTTRSSNPQKEEANTVSGRVRITWTGWQEVLLPRQAFIHAPGKNRTNWRDVQRLEFSFPERSAPDLVLHFRNVRVGDPVGPRLLDRELLELVDLKRPELTEVRRVADTGDVAAAMKALAAYYRQRRTVKWWFDPHQRDPASVKPNLKSIDEMVAGNLTIIYRRFPFRGGVADWHINPTADQPNQTDEWPVKLMAPDRSLPKVNDTGAEERMTYKPELAQLFPESSLVRWAVSLNHPTSVAGSVEPPPWRSLYLESSGYAVMRSGWGRADNYACFDVGHLGGWHGHQDKLSLMVWSKGRELLFDGGGGTYDESVYRKYGQQTESHNTVMVDRLNQHRIFVPYVDPIGIDDPATPAPIFVTQPDWDYASDWFVGGYGRDKKRIAQHRREVAMLRGKLFLVSDTLTPADGAAHEYEARWHLKTTKWTHEKAIAATRTADQGKPNLLVVPLTSAGLQVREDSAVKSPRLLGWDVKRDRDPAPALTVRHTRAGAGVQHFVTLLLPLAAGETNPVRAVQREGDRRWEVAFSSGRKLLVEIAAFAGNGFKVTDVSSSGERPEYAIEAPSP